MLKMYVEYGFKRVKPYSVGGRLVVVYNLGVYHLAFGLAGAVVLLRGRAAVATGATTLLGGSGLISNTAAAGIFAAEMLLIQ